jgi:hypothetical protein
MPSTTQRPYQVRSYKSGAAGYEYCVRLYVITSTQFSIFLTNLCVIRSGQLRQTEQSVRTILQSNLNYLNNSVVAVAKGSEYLYVHRIHSSLSRADVKPASKSRPTPTAKNVSRLLNSCGSKIRRASITAGVAMD